MAPQQGPCNWGTALQLLEEPGVAEAWVPAFEAVIQLVSTSMVTILI